MRSASDHFSLRTSRDSDSVRLVVSLSKKNFKKAVTRNTIRRRVKAILRSRNDLAPGTYMLVGKPGAEKLRGEDLKKELSKLL